MNYNLGLDENKNWLVSQESFDIDFLGKTETIMAIGNGYIGARAANEERNLGETRNTFIAGIFNKADEYEVTELANLPDVFAFDIELNGNKFNLSNGKIHHCNKTLNLKN
ncbi:MAG: glycoside hydrolase family 65 protein, partial [Ignavibacteria bacterium]|nr:glycoside hydrolase family 65 protein [Ignavibacteria bacterium]